jgi:hypothetical protein
VIEAASDKARVAEAVAGLVRMIREAPDEVLLSLAHFDSQAMPEDHIKSERALREVIDHLDCRLDRQPDNHWNPREPVELAAYGVDGQSQSLTAVANALLMISDLEVDAYDYMDYRWNNSPGQAYFEDLPERFRVPLMAGFDILKERWAKHG